VFVVEGMWRRAKVLEGMTGCDLKGMWALKNSRRGVCLKWISKSDEH
jgi:hypothetical protein